MDLKESELAKPNSRHPWELARAYFLIKKIIPIHSKKLLDIGSGDLFLLKLFLQQSKTQVTAVDNNFQDLNSNHQNIILEKNFKNLNFNDFEIITLFDVLEHVLDDNAFIGEVIKFLKPVGTIIITVPAYQYLFSNHDVFLKHFRRYSKQNLHLIMENHNLEIIKEFHFFTSLYFYRCFQRFITKQLDSSFQKGLANWNFDEGSVITKLITYFLFFDCLVSFFLSKFKINIPGLSICLVARPKKSKEL